MGLIIDGIGTSEAIDSSGELLELKGLDISDLVEGRAVLNTEHRGDDAPGYSYLDIIGRVIYAKKIYKRDDCENERQRKYWDEVKLPYLYIKNELFDDDEDGEHASAKAAAAMIRHYSRRNLPVLIRYSIEGSTLSMEDKVIKSAIARRVAATIKPCNKTCHSGILQDERDKSVKSKKEGSFEGGLGGLLEESGITKFERPDQVTLGCSVTMAWNPEVDEVADDFTKSAQQVIDLAKAIEGGSYNAAPGSLTGGAALQREDLGEEHRRLVNVTKAAIRDHNPAVHGPFRQYLKSLLPEACDEFLDRFADLADELNTSKLKLGYLKKARASVAEAETQMEEPEPSKPEHGTQSTRPRQQREADYQETLARIKEARETALFEDDEAAIPPIEKMKKVKPRKDMKYGKMQVDPERGILYLGGTPEGSKRNITPSAWRLYSPADDPKYMELLTKDENNVHHDNAMDNWVTVHRLLRQGKLPSKLIAHTSLYTLMAPNESGPIQDLSYALFQDLISKGFDPTKEYDPDDLSDWEREYGDMAMGQYLPQYMRDHFLSDAANIWREPTPAEKISGTVRAGMHSAQPLSDFGDNPRLRASVGKLSLGNKPQPGKWSTAARYHHTHAFLDSLVKQYGTNANDVIYQFLMQKRKDPEHGFGFAIKTARYTGGMLGIGQHVVPDTHFIRHLFGLHPDDPRIGDVKSLFASDSPDREASLQGIDQWFRLHHPAFEWTRQKLQRRYGEDFGEQATFPAFWLHWTLIAPHDRVRGWPAGQAANEGTDHEVFWNSARNILREFDLPTDPHDPRLRKAEAWKHGGSLPARTAHAMKAMEDRFGPTGASLFYYRFLVPVLLAPDKPAELYKAELLARLAKGEFSEEKKSQQVVMHKGATVIPGEIQWTVGPRAGQSMPLVAIGKDYHHVLGEDGSLMKMKAGHPNSRIIREPTLKRTSTMVDSKKHGHPSLHGTDIQHDLIHGIDLAKRISQPKKGVTWREHDTHGVTGWYQSKEGHLAFVKPNVGMDSFVDISNEQNDTFGPSHREAAFHRLATDVFGLGDYVPPTTVFRHPVTGEWLSAQKRVEGEHYSPTSMMHKESLGHMARTGLLDKLTLMDMILGHFDRHTENGLIEPNGRSLQLIDNGLAFAPHTPGHPEAFVPNVSEYWKAGNRHNDGAQWYMQPLHPEAISWAESIDPQRMAKHMDRLGIPKSERDEAIRRLTALKKRIAKGNVTRGGAYYSPFLTRTTAPSEKAAIEDTSGLYEPVR